MPSEVFNPALLASLPPGKVTGRVKRAGGLEVEAVGLDAPVGARCRIRLASGRTLEAEVIAARAGSSILTPYSEGGTPPAFGIRPGDPVEWTGRIEEMPVGWGLLGRVVDAFGNPLDGKGPIAAASRAPLYRGSPHPLLRPRISRPLETGIRSIDGLLTVGKGQRVGIFAGSGVGKSVLLGMVARHTAAPVRVVALIGERGREVREFIERELGPEGLSRSVVVVATGDAPPPVRVRAAFAAMTAAEFFRDEGEDVVFLMDSVTRIAQAQRELGLAAGEPPTTRGYTPSVFNILPRLLERAGTSETGSITGFFAVLVDQDDLSEPIADAARSILDGHIWLSRALASEGLYPAVDILNSISRLMPDVASREHVEAAALFRRVWAAYDRARDMVDLGAYVRGSRPDVDAGIEHMEEIRAFLAQPVDMKVSLPQTLQQLQNLCNAFGETLERVSRAAAPQGGKEGDNA